MPPTRRGLETASGRLDDVEARPRTRQDIDDERVAGRCEIGKLRPRVGDHVYVAPELLLHLEHIVLSHHGEREWGSPVLPATPEAMLIHHVDNLDAKTTMVLEAIKGDKNLDEEFTEYHRTLERHLYKVRPKPAGEAGEG